MSARPPLSELYYDPNYNPGLSVLTFTSIYGNNTDISFDDLQSIVNQRINESIMFGVRCGAACLTLVIMWMISKNKRTPIFIINQCSLVLIIVHSGLYFAYLLSNFSSITFTLTGFPQFVSRNNVHVFGAANIIQVLLIASIEISLIFQIRVIFKGDNFKRVGNCLLAIATALGIVTVVMYFVTAVTGMIAVYDDVNSSAQIYFNVSTILLATSINFMTVILIVKLVLAIRSRRFLGLKQFDNFHILLIMASQTLIIPSIMFILAYSLNADLHADELVVIGTLLVVLSLPLSSMWASAANNSLKPSSIVADTCSRKDNASSIYAPSIGSTLISKIISKFPPLNHKSNYSSDEKSERTYIGQYDAEKNSFSPGSHHSDNDKDPFSVDVSSLQTSIRSKPTQQSNKEPYSAYAETDEEAKKFWSNLNSSRISSITPNDMRTTNYSNQNSDFTNIPHMNDDDEFLETKRITLKEQ